MRAVIASGTGRYSDPWHPFPATSPLIAGILDDAGFRVDIVDDVDAAMGSLEGVDLLVVNAADPWRGEDPAAAPTVPARSIDGLAGALERGIGVIAMHCATASLRDYPEWFPAIGGMWIPGMSFHPPADQTHVDGGTLPDATIVPGFDVFDECYCRIQPIGRSHAVAHHHGAGHPEPAAWVRTHGASRVAVDLLGHDERSYEADGHRRLLAALASWVAPARG